MKTIKNWNSFNESKNKCEHKNKKNINSNKINDASNVIEVECLDCGMHRHENRDKNGKIETSKWFTVRGK
jgi:hypothetical protein